ncbi:hypothetical protein ACP70R_018719 [Stipagrostis hirtigluma subsp. patula]
MGLSSDNIHLSPYMASSSSKDDLSKSPISEILPISRPGYGTKGQQILALLRANHV